MESFIRVTRTGPNGGIIHVALSKVVHMETIKATEKEAEHTKIKLVDGSDLLVKETVGLIIQVATGMSNTFKEVKVANV
jgi:hypothetical protein